MAPATTFHSFPKLPPELRVKIYRMAIQPRFVELLEPSPWFDYDEHEGITEEEREQWAREGRLFSLAPIPSLLHTCFESRRTLIEEGYELAFGYQGSSYKIGTWFCFDHDALFLDEAPFHTMSFCQCRSALFGGRGIQPDESMEAWDWIECDGADLIPAFTARPLGCCVLRPAIFTREWRPWHGHPLDILNWRDEHEGNIDGFFENESRLLQATVKVLYKEGPRPLGHGRRRDTCIPTIHYAIVGRPSVLNELRNARETYRRTVKWIPNAPGGWEWGIKKAQRDSPDAPGSLEKQIEEAEEWERNILQEVDEEVEKQQLHQYEEDWMKYQFDSEQETEAYYWVWIRSFGEMQRQLEREREEFLRDVEEAQRHGPEPGSPL
ncbi:hypothetical protein B0T16DRAFT_386479 [Cercophora newfieldiana]|uniref:2EXR domain-containing protein n=1 Tax=Cercophora newfieldiana TaxID=92897 RepID=A0AA39YSW8_9PEZI|nr:hypothetical protein B0T16DRAFT_386479 [Cercophora newfieldiana]